MHYILPKLMLGKTLDGEFKLLRIKELDNDDVDVKPDSSMKIHLQTNEFWCRVERTLVASDEIQVKRDAKRLSCTGSGQML